MSDDRTTNEGGEPVHTHTTVIEKRGGGSGILIGIVLLIAVAIGAFYLMNRANNDNAQTDAITQAAKSVGDGADKVGDAAKKAAE